ncbi:MAG: hypothetical protein R3E02_09285 [Blastomonas sp.]
MTLRRLILLFLAPLMFHAQSAWAAVTITFYSHEFGSEFPHAFVTLKGTLDGSGERIDTNYGFTPVNVGPHLLWGWAKGRLDIAEAEYVADSNPHFRMTISDAEYGKVMEVVNGWGNRKQKSYNLNKANCVHFVGEIAEAVGLKINRKSENFKKPRSFLIEVTDLNRSRFTAAQLLYKGS